MRHVQFQQKHIYCGSEDKEEKDSQKSFPIGKLSTPPSTDFFLVTHLLLHKGDNQMPPLIEAWMASDGEVTALWSDEKLATEQKKITDKWRWGLI